MTRDDVQSLIFIEVKTAVPIVSYPSAIDYLPRRSMGPVNVVNALSRMELHQVGEYMYPYCCLYLLRTNTSSLVETIIKAHLITVQREEGKTKNIWVWWPDSFLLTHVLKPHALQEYLVEVHIINSVLLITF